MSELRFEPFEITGSPVGKSSWYPAVRELIKSDMDADLDEDDGLFIGYGMIKDGLPYTLQDNYDVPQKKLTFQAIQKVTVSQVLSKNGINTDSQ